MTEDSSTTGDRSARRGTAFDWVGLAARLILAAVFLIAGIEKASNIPATQDATRAYQILPYDLASAWGLAMPFVEIVFGLLLLVGLVTRLSAIVTGLLLVAFIIGIISVWARGMSIDCGCFGGGGPAAHPSYWVDLLRDTGLLLCAAWLVVRPRSKFALDSRIS